MIQPAVVLAASFAFGLASAATPGTFEIVGNSGVSAQQLFLGNSEKVYILDKVQGNAATVSGHPAWVVGEPSIQLDVVGCPVIGRSKYTFFVIQSTTSTRIPSGQWIYGPTRSVQVRCMSIRRIDGH